MTQEGLRHPRLVCVSVCVCVCLSVCVCWGRGVGDQSKVDSQKLGSLTFCQNLEMG